MKDPRKINWKKAIPLLAAILLIVCLCWYVSAYWYQFVLIRGKSMMPTYHPLQLVLLEKCVQEYRTGDVIAFRCEGFDTVLIKRIAAGPGDTVVIADGTLLVNGTPTPLYREGAFGFAGLLDREITLADGEYIVIGDNIAESKDSRYPQVGVVRPETILGRLVRSAAPKNN